MVERRDQMRMISLRPELRDASALLSRYPSTNGPFHTERAISVLPLRTAADDQASGPLVGASLITLGRHAPGGDRVPAARGAALAAAVRVVDRVHHDAAVVRAAAEPARAAGLADLLVLPVRIAHRADRRHALGANHSQLARLQLDLRVTGVLADQLGVGTRRARHLAAAADLQLDVVDDGADRHTGHRHRVARLNIDPLARHDLV